jgi:hypothetical protein
LQQHLQQDSAEQQQQQQQAPAPAHMRP